MADAFKIRSFVKRGGRLTKSQQHGLTTLLPHYSALGHPAPLDFFALFGNTAPVQLEIGFGNGEALIAMAEAAPKTNFLGVEVHDPGVGHVASRIHDLHLQNVRLAHTDAMEFITQIADASLEKIMLFFPDPWHKKKHHKRRIIRSEFMCEIVRTLQTGGVFHMATDWQDYAEQAVAQINLVAELQNLSPDNDYMPRPKNRPLTKFEQRGHRLGHGVWDMFWEKS